MSKWSLGGLGLCATITGTAFVLIYLADRHLGHTLNPLAIVFFAVGVLCFLLCLSKRIPVVTEDTDVLMICLLLMPLLALPELYLGMKYDMESMGVMGISHIVHLPIAVIVWNAGQNKTRKNASKTVTEESKKQTGIVIAPTGEKESQCKKQGEEGSKKQTESVTMPTVENARKNQKAEEATHLRQWKYAQEQAAQEREKARAKRLEPYEAPSGDSILFGTYPHYNEMKSEPVEWIILGESHDAVILISKYALITSAYCDAKKCEQSLRFLEWQNSIAHEVCTEFYDRAFSASEKEQLLPLQQTGENANQNDHVFLLTEKEVTEYLPDPINRKAKPTPLAIEKGARLGWTDDTREFTSWWIMPEMQYVQYGRIISMQGEEYNKLIYPKAVFQNGEIQFHGRNIYHGDFTIRPCIRMKKLPNRVAADEKCEIPPKD